MEPGADGRAFGLDVSAAFEVAGLAPPAPRPTRRVEIDTASVAAIEAMLASARGVRRISDRPGYSIDAHSEAGYLLACSGFGVHHVSADGRRIRCAAPGDPEDWAWQRFLTGQLLPFAALLQGLEVFHAGAAVVDGRALAVVGASGAGKSSLVAAMVLRGAGFLTDDVLALEVSGGRLVAHPGPALQNIRRGAGSLGEELERRNAGRLGADDEAVRLVVRPHGGSCELGALAVLQRGGEDAEAAVEPMAADARTLLAASFNFVLRSPQRLVRQLDVCARIGRGPLLRVSLPARGSSPAEAAAQLERAARAAWTATTPDAA